VAGRRWSRNWDRPRNPPHLLQPLDGGERRAQVDEAPQLQVYTLAHHVDLHDRDVAAFTGLEDPQPIGPRRVLRDRAGRQPGGFEAGGQFPREVGPRNGEDGRAVPAVPAR
jgi:hypothetical protein